MILVSSLNLFMTSSGWQENFPLISSFLQIVIKLLPYMLVWMLFIFLYMFMPATPVKFKHAFVAAMIAGTVYQIIQWFYIRFQIGMSSYSAIYGTLAALPLFIGVVAVEVECRVVGDGIVLYFPEQAFHV